MADSYGFIGGLKVATDTVTDGNGGTANVLKTTGGGAGGSTTVQGAGANGAATSGNPVLVAGSDGTNSRTVATDTSGRIQVVPYVGTVALAALADNADGVAVSATVNGQKVSSRDYVFNGTSWDRMRKPNAFNRVPSSAASGNPAVGKASAGDVMQFWGQNGAAITYLQIYNKATAPVIGTDTPLLTFPIPANATFSQTIPNGGAYFGTGIAYAFTTDAAGTTGAAAAAVTAFNLLVA